jgi:phosphoribosylamine--glycine ligase/phosphoribosylglycinamide formyltransferase/phosphoribosylformylglycinamidine cyclo-ligase
VCFVISRADFPALVVKAAGLAAGKGVVVASSQNEACAAVDTMLTEKQFGSAGETVVVEELLQGEEVLVRRIAQMLFNDDCQCMICVFRF